MAGRAGTTLGRGLVVATTGLALLVAGCGGSGTGASTAPPSPASPTGPTGPTASTAASTKASFQPGPADFRAIRSLLARRASALLDHDRSAYLATVDPTQPALVEQQSTFYDNVAQLPVSHLRYGIDTSAALVPAGIPGHDPVLHPAVVEHLQLAGTFVRPISNSVDQTFVRRDGHWLLGAESQATDRNAFDAAQERPWFGVPIVARHVGPLTVLVDRSQSGSLATLSTAIRDDIAYDAHLLGVAPSYRLLVDATTNGLSYDFSSLSTEEAAAVTFGVTATDPLGQQVTGLAGTAVKVNPKLVGQVVNDAGILRHELTHYLLRASSGSSPKWLVEGVATWVQYYPDDFSAYTVPADLYDRLMHADRTLPIIGLFNEDPSVNYPISQAAVTWLVSHFGIAKLLELMRAYRTDYAGADVDALTPRLLRQVYGVTQQQVVAGAFGLLATFQH
ncbi:hypothetical protein [Nocardioides cynanchi]|uniref:hypothetical protein n=1 Tax=Nocardioides cynanchi TaxID=2558918 RepID=UPI00124491D7|nr:hypothetical protein [Nocardioides cynanchi]